MTHLVRGPSFRLASFSLVAKSKKFKVVLIADGGGAPGALCVHDHTLYLAHPFTAEHARDVLANCLHIDKAAVAVNLGLQ